MKMCGFCKVVPVRAATRTYCSLLCSGKGKAARRRAGVEPPPPVAKAEWLPLADGRFALVDEDLAQELGRYSWSGGGPGGSYAATGIGGKHVYLHQMVGAGARMDHKNGNRLDCRRENLRPATQRQNTGNLKSRAKIAPYKGICKNGPGWAASIRVSGYRKHLGTYATPEEAARVYDVAAREVHGEFACVNFPEEGERGALQ